MEMFPIISCNHMDCVPSVFLFALLYFHFPIRETGWDKTNETKQKSCPVVQCFSNFNVDVNSDPVGLARGSENVHVERASK